MNHLTDRQAFWVTQMARGLAALIGLGCVVWLGIKADHEMPRVEQWLQSLGFWAPVTFALLLIVGTTFLLPDTPFAIVAGALFGLGWGTVLMVVSCLLGAVLNFWISRRWLRQHVLRKLQQRPKLSAVEQAASHEGAKLQLLLRMMPIHAATFNYVMGVSRVRFADYLLGCLGLVPTLFLEVYFGYLAAHVTNLTTATNPTSKLHTVVVIAGFVLSLAVLTYIMFIARRAVAAYERADAQPAQP